jgi:hypothetical protein
MLVRDVRVWTSGSVIVSQPSALEQGAWIRTERVQDVDHVGRVVGPGRVGVWWPVCALQFQLHVLALGRARGLLPLEEAQLGGHGAGCLCEPVGLCMRPVGLGRGGGAGGGGLQLDALLEGGQARGGLREGVGRGVLGVVGVLQLVGRGHAADAYARLAHADDGPALGRRVAS